MKPKKHRNEPAAALTSPLRLKAAAALQPRSRVLQPNLAAAAHTPLKPLLISAPSLILGIDPGLSGALALYNPAQKDLFSITDMPLVASKSGKLSPDATKIAFFLETYSRQISYVVLEDVGAMPNQGVSSMFRFGFGVGVLVGTLAAFFLPVVKVRPAIWKAVLHLDSDKKKSLSLAVDLFPRHAQLFERVKDDGRAEAALLAVYGGLVKPLGL